MKTDRLLLEKLTTKDVALFHRINTNTFVRKYLWEDEVISLELSKEIFAISEEKHQSE